MTTISAADAIGLWETGWSLLPLQRAVLLAAAAEGSTPAAVSALPVGRRNRALYTLQAELFGTVLDGVASCPECATQVELSLDCERLLASISDPAPQVLVDEGGRRHRFRTPTSADLAAILAIESAADAGETVLPLLRRCLLEGSDDAFAADPSPVLSAWDEADPLADVVLAMACPHCGHRWDEPMDIAGFLWFELDTWCRSTLVDVHELARTYGWTEPDVLALSPWRRQCYLGLVGA